MKNIIIPTHAVEHLKKQAKRLKKEHDISHTEALERVAKQIDFEHWHALTLANKKIQPAESAFKDGCVLVFDIKEGMDVSSNKMLVQDSMLEIVCEKAMDRIYCNMLDEDDLRGRTYEQTLTLEELEENIRECDYVFFRLSESAFKQCSSLEQVMDLVSEYSFWPPLYVFIKGKLFDVCGTQA